MPDIFFSHAHVDAEITRRILDGLRQQGLEVWYDETDVPHFTSISRLVKDGLYTSKVLLSYYSATYPTRRACQWELTAAFIAAQQAGDVRERVFVLNPEESSEHIEPAELQDARYFRISSGTGNRELADLGDALRQRLDHLSGTLRDFLSPSPAQWFGIALPVGASRFVGRTADMWRLHSALQAGEVELVSGAYGPDFVQLVGMGGVGKTLLAKEYALRFGAAYPGGVFMLQAAPLEPDAEGGTRVETLADLRTQLRNIAAQIGVQATEDLTDGEIRGAIHEHIEQANHPSLWIVDDFPPAMELELLREWIAPNPHAKTLLTTRTHEYKSLGRQVPLGVLTADEAMELLSKHLSFSSPAEQTDAISLVEDLGYHPLAVDVAGAALAAQRGLISIGEYRTALSNTEPDELEVAAGLTGVLPTGHEPSITTTLRRSVDRLEPDGRMILKLASILSPADIPVDYHAGTLSRLNGYSMEEARVRTARGLHAVSTLSLADVTGSGTYRVHSLVSRLVRLSALDESSPTLVAAAIEELLAKLPSPDLLRAEESVIRFLPHARRLIDGRECRPMADLVNWLSRYDILHADYESALLLSKRRVELLVTFATGDTRSILTALSDVAHITGVTSGASTAEKLTREVLAARRQHLGENDEDTLTSKTNLAMLLLNLGNYEEAQSLQEEEVEARLTSSGSGPRDIATSLDNLATVHHERGSLSEARRLQELALGIVEPLFGSEDGDVLISKGNLARTLRELGELQEARALVESILQTYEEHLGPTHPKTLGAKTGLAKIYQDVGLIREAAQMQEDVVRVSRQTFGPRHATTKGNVVGLAHLLHVLGDHERANNELASAFDFGSFETTSVDELSAWDAYAEATLFQGNHQTAIRIRRAVLARREATLGAVHPLTLISMNNLGNTLSHAGQLDEAIELLTKVADGRRALFGDAHRDTLIAKDNLGMAYRQRGDLQQARGIQEEALQLFRRHFGDSHQDALVCMNGLARTLFLAGDLTSAKVLAIEAAERREALFGTEHPDTEQSFILLMMIVRAGGEASAEDRRLLIGYAQRREELDA